MLKKLLKQDIESVLFKEPFNKEKMLKKFHSNEYNEKLLCKAASLNKAEAIYFLYNQNVDINALDSKNENALFYAIRSGSSKAIKMLLKLNLNVNQISLGRKSALYYAMIHDSLMFVDIAKKTTDTNILGEVLYRAVKLKKEHIVSVLLNNKNTNINWKSAENKCIVHEKELMIFSDSLLRRLFVAGINITEKNENGESFLLNCIFNKKIKNDFIELMLKIREPLKKNVFNSYSEILSPMVKDIYSSNQRVVQNQKSFDFIKDRLLILLRGGIDVNSANSNGENIAFEIVRNGSLELLKFLADESPIDMHKYNHQKINLLEASVFCENPNEDIIIYLLQSGVSYQSEDEKGNSLIEKIVNLISHNFSPFRYPKLKSLIGRKKLDTSKILNLIMEFGDTEINEIAINKEPILHYIAKTFNTHLLEKLIRYGGNVNTLNKEGLNTINSVLRVDGLKNKDKIEFLNTIKFLVQRDADILQRDDFGGNAIHYSILKHELQVINLLTRRIVDFKITDKSKRTYIHYAVWNNKVDVIKKLSLLCKELVNMPDKYGFLPLNYAILLGKKDAAIALLNHGAFINNKYTINEKYKKHLFEHSDNIGYELIFKTSMTSTEEKVIKKVIEAMKEKF